MRAFRGSSGGNPWVTSALMLGIVAGAVPARAQDDAVKARKENFKLLSDQVRDLVRGLGDGAPVSAMRDRVTVARQALERVPSLFPPGSMTGDTKALGVVWTDPARFATVYAAARDRMDELAVTAASDDRDAFGAAVGRMAAACGACHVVFRSQ